MKIKTFATNLFKNNNNIEKKFMFSFLKFIKLEQKTIFKNT